MFLFMIIFLWIRRFRYAYSRNKLYYSLHSMSFRISWTAETFRSGTIWIRYRMVVGCQIKCQNIWKSMYGEILAELLTRDFATKTLSLKVHGFKNSTFIHFILWISLNMNCGSLTCKRPYCIILILIYFDQSTWLSPIGFISIDPFRSIILTNCKTLELDRVTTFDPRNRLGNKLIAFGQSHVSNNGRLAMKHCWIFKFWQVSKCGLRKEIWICKSAKCSRKDLNNRFSEEDFIGGEVYRRRFLRRFFWGGLSEEAWLNFRSNFK